MRLSADIFHQNKTVAKSRLIWFYAVGTIAIVILLVSVWREWAWRQLPLDTVKIPPIVKEEVLEIPPRPGVRGVIIAGPTIEPLTFAIDLNKSGGLNLNWLELRAVDPHTDVKVTCRVDQQGRLNFRQDDVLMEGHTEAGMMIQAALRTWIYTPYKSGIIRFWFNLPSKGRKLIIDTHQLSRKVDIPPHITVYDGKLHLVDRIPLQDVHIGGYF